MQNEDQLMLEFNQGKEEAFVEISKRFRNNLLYFAKRLVKSQENSEDIVSDIFVLVFKRHRDFETLDNLKSFLYISTRNACFTLLKQNGQVVPISDNDPLYNVSESPPDEPYWLTVETELIKQLVETLPPTCRQIFKMHYYRNMKQNKIASELNVTEATVSEQLKIARGKIKKLLMLVSFLIIISLLKK